MIFCHMMQQFKAVHHRHNDIQQHQGNACPLPFQQMQRLFAVDRLVNDIRISQHFRQNRTVHLRIVHDQNFLLAFLVRNRICLRDNHCIFLVLRLVHQNIRTVYRLIQQCIFTVHAADANRKVDTGIPRDRSIVYLMANVVQLSVKLLLIRICRQQYKLIAAVADQHIIAVRAFPYHLDHRFQHHIPGIVTAGVIVHLKVIQVDHGSAAGKLLLSGSVFQIPPVIRSGQCIPVQFHMIMRQLPDQLVPFTCPDQRIAVQFPDQFHHTGLSVHFNITGKDLVDICPQKFQFRVLLSVPQCLHGNAVFTRLSLAPIIVAFAKRRIFCAFPDAFQIFALQKAHHGKHIPEKAHLLFCLL